MFVFRVFLVAALALITPLAGAPAARAAGIPDTVPVRSGALATGIPGTAPFRSATIGSTTMPTGIPGDAPATPDPTATGIPGEVPARPDVTGTGIPGEVPARPDPADGGIPGKAMLRPSDLGGAEIRDAGTDSWPALRPPRPCGLPAPEAVTDRAASAIVDADRAPVVVMEYVALHPAGGADRYLRRLRAAARDCPDWRLEKSGSRTLTLRWTQTWEHVGEQVTHHTYVAVARTGRAVVLVADLGWETSDGERARAERLLIPARRRAAVLR